MGMAIEAYWAKTEKSGAIIRAGKCAPLDCLNMPEDFKRFFQGEAVATIAKDYDKERTFKSVSLPLKSDVEKDTYSKIGSVTIQKNFKKAGGMESSQIRQNTSLDAWLTGCLKNGKGVRSNNFHPVLGQHYDIFEFSLADANRVSFTVEIAVTREKVSHTYRPDDGAASVELETNICWVRDVFYNNTTISSFGTRKEIPINLSFLVQKPIDYFEQVSAEYLKGIALEKDKAEVEKALTKTDGKGINKTKLEELFKDKGGYKDIYIILSYLNESTSTLIAEFKSKKNYPLFAARHAGPIRPSLNINYGHKETDFALMQQRLVIGINEYYCLRLDSGVYSTKGHHGDAGLNRADALRNAIMQCKK